MIINTKSHYLSLRSSKFNSKELIEYGDKLAVCIHHSEEIGGLRIVDISEPTEPVVVSQIDCDDRVTGVAIRDDIAYLSVFNEGFQIVDLTSMTVLGRVPLPQQPVRPAPVRVVRRRRGLSQVHRRLPRPRGGGSGR